MAPYAHPHAKLCSTGGGAAGEGRNGELPEKLCGKVLGKYDYDLNIDVSKSFMDMPLSSFNSLIIRLDILTAPPRPLKP